MTKPYKLSAEIKGFIVEKKKNDPLLSCRQLAPLVWSRFQLKLSKSSVNAILKTEKLSSNVGRRRIRPPKFALKIQSSPVIPSVPVVPDRLENINPSGTEEPKKFTLTENIPAPADKVLPARPAESAVPLPDPIKKEKIPEPDSRKEAAEEKSPSEEKPAAPEEPVEQPVEAEPVINLIHAHREVEFIDTAGCFLLMAADYKSSFTGFLAKKISPLFPDLKPEIINFFLEALLYKHIIKEERTLNRLLGREMDAAAFSHVHKRLSGMDWMTVRYDLLQLGLDQNHMGNLDVLSRGLLQRLNALVENLFFPSVYQSLDFSTMYARFYCLKGKIERKEGLLAVQFSFPRDFAWSYDIVWQEDFLVAVNKVNQEKIPLPGNEIIWFDPRIGPGR